MKLPFKVPAIVLAALAALFMSFGSAIVGTGVANANPWCNNIQVGWQSGGCNNQWGHGWQGNNWQNNNCGPGCGHHQDHRVWKEGPAGRPPVLVNWQDQWKQWCWDPFLNDFVLR